MQAYGRMFAQVYNQRWSAFARQVSPRILEFYSDTPVANTNKSILDLGCGTGQLAVHFLENGYEVVGVDASEHMLHHASENVRSFVEAGKVSFIQADVTDFHLDGRFGLVVSTLDTLNHLADVDALVCCFKCVAPANTGFFIFDLNTRVGLNRWNSIQVDDSDETLIITRGIFDGVSDRAWTRISGFVRRENGGFDRFDETAFNTVFELTRVRDELERAGWRGVYFARMQDLRTPIDEPEREGRVFVVASK
jgi:SAM-dependent methyltransferase